MVWNSNTGGQELQRVSSGTYDLVFTIEGTIQNTVSSELGSQEIRVGKSHIVKTDLFELEHGVITSCERTSLGAESKLGSLPCFINRAKTDHSNRWSGLFYA